MERKYLELVEDSFTQEHLDKQNNQKPYVAYSIKDGNVIYNIVPKEGGTMYTIYRVVKKDISNCTYNMVDLGLSSGTLWADRNVGATSPEHYGSYFQWGDTNAYTFDGVGEVTAAELAELLNPMFGPHFGMEITADNVGMILEQMLGITGTDLTNTPMGALGFSLDKFFYWDSYFDTTDGGSTFNKYNNNGGLTVLESIDDAATVHMGSQYRMPTKELYMELINETNVTYILHDDNGNEYVVTFDDSTGGYKDSYTVSPELSEGVDMWSFKLDRLIFTNKSDSNKSIYFKANGGCLGSLGSFDSGGGGWASNLGYDSTAYTLDFNHGNVLCFGGRDRSYGAGVRGVQP